MAMWYIFYFNLIKPRLSGGRRYVAAVNAFLEQTSRRPFGRADTCEPGSFHQPLHPTELAH